MSQEVRFEYAMKAARAAEGDGGNAGLSLVPHARREIPALTPLGWDRSRPEPNAHIQHCDSASEWYLEWHASQCDIHPPYGLYWSGFFYLYSQ